MSNSLGPDQAQHLVGLIWVQNVCKGYQQTDTIVGKELIHNIVTFLHKGIEDADVQNNCIIRTIQIQ